MDKFQPTYRLQIGTNDGLGSVVIEPPFTLEVDITRNRLTSANVCQLRILNLGEITRNRIRRNQSQYGEPYQGIILEAGYGTNISRIFSGNITMAWNVRQGQDIVTQIECFDGGYDYVNNVSSVTYTRGTPNQVVIQNLAGSLAYTTVGAVATFPGALVRANSYIGPTMGVLGEITGGATFIDNGKLNVLRTNEYIENGLTTVINSATGLLGTPVLEFSIARFEMLFEPTLNIGRRVLVASTVEKAFNGTYIIDSVKHRGTFSPAVGATVITTGEFAFFKQLVPVVPQ